MRPLFVDIASAIPVVVEGSSEKRPVYAPELAALNGLEASGVYVILSRSGRVLYVGESHTGRLYGTITRHFRKWSPSRGAAYANGRRFGGVPYDREKCFVAWEVCEPEQCAAFQWAEIVRLSPADNSVPATPAEVREVVADEWVGEVPF